jgi:hypothetical protein
MPMAATKKKDIKVTVVKKMRDCSQDPTFRKKAEKTKAFLQKHGLPPQSKGK